MFRFCSILFFCFIILNAVGQEQFNFDVTEIEIIENGNKFIGKKRGTITSDDGIIINAENFEYDKELNILNVTGNVEIEDKHRNFKLYSDFIEYFKNEGKIFSKGKSRAIDLKDNNEIKAKYFEYNIPENTIEAKENVIIENKKENYKIFTDLTVYNRNREIINTIGKSSAIFQSKYKFETKNVTLLKKSMEFFSKDKATLIDNSNLYNLSNFRYLADKEIIKGEKIVINSNYKLPSSDKFYFSNGILNLKNQNFIAKDTKIEIHKSVFDKLENDPRVLGVSSVNNNEFSIIKKGVFTSCKKNDGCPPWLIQSNEIKHDKIKREIHYKNAILKLYNVPVLYFPKFYHPDPTVKRKSGFLQPTLNSSNVLGSSFALPYFYEIKENKDITIAPIIFDGDNKLIQNEYREIGKNYNLISNFGHGRDYYSKITKQKKNTSYLFSKLDYDLGLEGFNESKINFNIEKINNDTFLKVFDSTLLDETTSLKPIDPNVLNSSLKASLNKSEYSFVTGIEAYETLSLKNSDRFQYILPYYNFNKNIFTNYEHGTFNFNSNGRNDLNNTNQLKSEIINDISFSAFDVLSIKGLKNSFNVNLKNINSVGKNIENYKSSPKVELSSIFNLQTSYPLQKKTEGELNTLTPKASFLYNPGDMKNHGSSIQTIDINNLFSINRLGLSNTFETGKSLTLGIDYKKELLNDVNKFFGFKIGTVYRNKSEDFIPNNTTLNKKRSNVFGSITNKFSKNVELNYKFAADQNLNELQYNDVNATLSLNNFVTNFSFVKETSDMGDQELISNTTLLNFNDKNTLSFSTRKNRKLNLTEFYNLVYEYKNDCLTAGIKYNKTYYEDRDLKPTENLLFTITLFPLTTYEQKVDEDLY